MLEQGFSRRAALLGAVAAGVGWSTSAGSPVLPREPRQFRVAAGFTGRPESGLALLADAGPAAPPPVGPALLQRLHVDVDAPERIWLMLDGRTLWGPHLLPAGFSDIAFHSGSSGGLRIDDVSRLTVGLLYGSHGTIAAIGTMAEAGGPAGTVP